MLSDTSNAVDICSSLVRVVGTTSQRNGFSPQISLQQITFWSLDQFQRLWNVVIRYALLVNNHSGDGGDLYQLFFAKLKVVSTHAAFVGLRSSAVRRASTLWAQCFSDCVKMLFSGSQAVSEGTVAKILATTVAKASSESALRDAVEDILMPVLYSFILDRSLTFNLLSLRDVCNLPPPIWPYAEYHNRITFVSSMKP